MIAKLLEYTVVIPVWWVATYFAAFFYPVEDDPRQDMLGWVFSFFIVTGLLFGCGYLLRSPANPAPQTASATDAKNQPANPDLAILKSQLELLKQVPGLPGSDPADTQKSTTH